MSETRVELDGRTPYCVVSESKRERMKAYERALRGNDMNHDSCVFRAQRGEGEGVTVRCTTYTYGHTA